MSTRTRISGADKCHTTDVKLNFTGNILKEACTIFLIIDNNNNKPFFIEKRVIIIIISVSSVRINKLIRFKVHDASVRASFDAVFQAVHQSAKRSFDD